MAGYGTPTPPAYTDVKTKKNYQHRPQETEYMKPLNDLLSSRFGEPDWHNTWSMGTKELDDHIKAHQDRGVIWINDSLDRRTYNALDRITRQWDRPLWCVTSLTPYGLLDTHNVKFIAAMNYTYNFAEHIRRHHRNTVEWSQGYQDKIKAEHTFTMMVGTGDADRNHILRACLDHGLGHVGEWSHSGSRDWQIPRRIIGEDRRGIHIDWEEQFDTMGTIIDTMWRSRVVVGLENLCGQHPHSSITEKTLWGYLSLRPTIAISSPGADQLRKRLGFLPLSGIQQDRDQLSTEAKARDLIGELWRLHHQPYDQYRAWCDTQGDTISHNHEQVWQLSDRILGFVDQQLEKSA